MHPGARNHRHHGEDSRAVVRFYNKRGTAEQWIKEGKQAVKMTRLSCHRFRSNEVRLRLSVIAYSLGNLWRRLVLPLGVGSWSLTSLQQRLVIDRCTINAMVRAKKGGSPIAGCSPEVSRAICGCDQWNG